MEKTKFLSSIKDIRDSIKSIRANCYKLVEQKIKTDKAPDAAFIDATSAQNEAHTLDIRMLFRQSQSVIPL